MGQFLGVIDLQVIPGDADDWIVAKSFRYTTDAGDVIDIPEGQKTDLASTPRIIWNLLPPFGLYTGAAIVHDYLYCTAMFDRAKCDWILLEAMKEEGVGWIARHTIYRQVRWWGWAAWNEHRKRDKQQKEACENGSNNTTGSSTTPPSQ